MASCSSPEPDSTHSFRIYEEDGITIAETSNGPKYDSEIFQYEIQMHLESAESGDALLYAPMEMFSDDDGWFFVRDGGDYSIVVFDAQGQYQYRFGREGSGPGEFRRPHIQYIHDGIIYIYDPGLSRATLFRTSGELIKVISQPRSGTNTTAGIYPLPNETLLTLVWLNDYAEDGIYAAWQATGIDSESDTLWMNVTPRMKVGYIGPVDGGEEMIQFHRFYNFYPVSLATYHPSVGILIPRGWEPEIDLYDINGVLKTRIRIGFDPIPVTKSDREEVEAFARRLARTRSTVNPANLELELKSTQYPPNKSYWSSIQVDSNGWIYLEIRESYPPPHPLRFPVSYHVISPEGEWLGRTTRPAGKSRVYGDRLLTIYQDEETGERTLLVYNIQSVVEGLKYP